MGRMDPTVQTERHSPRGLYEWARSKAHSAKAPLWLTLLFSVELILIIPLDAVLMFFCLQHRAQTWLYVALTTLASLWSAALGYLVGHLLWDLVGPFVIPYLISPSLFQQISMHLEQHEMLATFLGALLPFPLKALSLTTGVFHLSFVPFLCAVGVARCIRFLIVGGTMFLWGARVQPFVERNFYRILLVISAKALMLLFAFWALAVA